MHPDDGVILLNDSGDFVWASAEAAEMLGFAPEEFIAASLASSGPIADAIENFAVTGAQRASGSARLPTKAGERLPVHWQLWALPRATAGMAFLLSISKPPKPAPLRLEFADYRQMVQNSFEGIFRAAI